MPDDARVIILRGRVVKRHPTLVIEIVEMSLRGSEFAMEAWQILRICILEDRNPDSEELERLDWLHDRAVDDLDGPGLRVDLSKGRIYK